MQLFNRGKVALTLKDITELLLLNLGQNEIGSKGCEYLNQAKWPKLTHLYLIQNNILSEGVKWICKSIGLNSYI